MIKLQAPQGCVEFSFGLIRIRPDEEGSVTVPEYLAAAMVEAGFTGADKPDPQGIGDNFEGIYILHAYGVRVGPYHLHPDEIKSKALELLKTRGSPKVKINP
jgi:hypothetical protein